MLSLLTTRAGRRLKEETQEGRRSAKLRKMAKEKWEATLRSVNYVSKTKLNRAQIDFFRLLKGTEQLVKHCKGNKESIFLQLNILQTQLDSFSDEPNFKKKEYAKKITSLMELLQKKKKVSSLLPNINPVKFSQIPCTTENTNFPPDEAKKNQNTMIMPNILHKKIKVDSQEKPFGITFLGNRVFDISPDCPATKSLLQIGWYLISINGHPQPRGNTTDDVLKTLMFAKKINQKITIEFSEGWNEKSESSWKVNCHKAINIQDKPSFDGKKLGTLLPGTIIVGQHEDSWLHHGKGWSLIRQGNIINLTLLNSYGLPTVILSNFTTPEWMKFNGTEANIYGINDDNALIVRRADGKRKIIPIQYCLLQNTQTWKTWTPIPSKPNRTSEEESNSIGSIVQDVKEKNQSILKSSKFLKEKDMHETKKNQLASKLDPFDSDGQMHAREQLLQDLMDSQTKQSYDHSEKDYLEEERKVQKELAQDMSDMTEQLMEKVKSIGQTLKNDSVMVDGTEDLVVTSREKHRKEDKRLDETLHSSIRSTILTTMALSVVGIVFVMMYIFMKLVPKPKY